MSASVLTLFTETTLDYPTGVTEIRQGDTVCGSISTRNEPMPGTPLHAGSPRFRLCSSWGM